MKQNETKKAETMQKNLASSLERKEAKEKRTIIAKKESLTAEEIEKLHKEKMNEEKRNEMLSKMTDEQKEEFFKKERQDRFLKRHKSCYLSLYAGFITKKNNEKASITLETEKFISEWGYILRLFTKKEYIKNIEFVNLNPKQTALLYDFNSNDLKYSDDCENLSRVLQINSLAIEPMNEIIKKKQNDDFDNIDKSNIKHDFHYEYNKETDENEEEIVSKQDSTNYKLNKNLTKEFIRKTNKDNIVVEIGKKFTGKSEEEIENDLEQAS